MFDIIRVTLPSGIKRFPMFTVKDQFKLMLTRIDMEGRPLKEQQEILDEVLELLYPGYSKTEQEYIFSRVYCGSFGKNVIKVVIGGKGGGHSEAFMVINDIQLENEYKLNDEITLGFNFPRTRNTSEELFLECISYVIYNEQRYEWTSLTEETKENILDIVELDDVEKIVTMLTKSVDVSMRGKSFSGMLTLFKILFSRGDLDEFVKTNYLLNKNGLNLEPIMNSSPMERQIYTALLAEDLKKQGAVK